MKKCNYCGTRAENSQTKCAACGASSFSYICENCGETIENGKFCPRCGVKVDAEKKTCPRCKETYYSQACPRCGYVPENQTNQPVQYVERVYSNENTQPVKKKTSFWTVLLWIFFLPIMGTIAIWKSKKMKLWLKLLLTAIIWIIVFSISCNNKKKENNTPSEPITSLTSNTKELQKDDLNADSTGSLEIAQTENEVIYLDANELGEYGKSKVGNEGTELEYKYIEFHVPAGKYEVQKNDKQAATQVSIYGNEYHINEDGWEEPAQVYGTCVVKVGAVEEIIVGENQYVKLSDNGAVILTKIG